MPKCYFGGVFASSPQNFGSKMPLQQDLGLFACLWGTRRIQLLAYGLAPSIMADGKGEVEHTRKCMCFPPLILEAFSDQALTACCSPVSQQPTRSSVTRGVLKDPGGSPMADWKKGAAWSSAKHPPAIFAHLLKVIFPRGNVCCVFL